MLSVPYGGSVAHCKAKTASSGSDNTFISVFALVILL